MRRTPFLTSTSARLCCAVTLFWVVGCQSGGTPAVASTTAEAAPSPQHSEAGEKKVTKKAESVSASDQPANQAIAKEAAAAEVVRAAADKPRVAPKAKATPLKSSPVKAEAKDKKANFSLKTTGASIKVGAKGAASVSIAPLNGYKWNKDYPAKLIFKASPKNVQLGKSEFKQMSGDFKVGDKKTSVPVSMKANTSGEETLAGVLKFSICNETACIIEKADIKLAVNVTP